MSWVLILIVDGNAPPAVIGGYPTHESADKAGELATRPIKSPEAGMWDRMQFYSRFTVIPGAAVDGPLGCTHSVLTRGDDHYAIVRQTYRYVEDGK
jgi:hypothetical protein